MRGRGRMAGERFRVTDIDPTLHHAQRVIEVLAALESAPDPESEQRRAIAVQVLPCELMVLAVGKSRVVHPFDAAVALKIFGDLARIGDMAFAAQRDRL